MISAQWVRMMARYNGWQNQQIMARVKALDDAALWQERGAFFGSIMGTLNHLVWGDLIWMQRFDGGAGPQVSQAESARAFPTAGAWEAARFRLDGRIRSWAGGLREIDLRGDLRWQSGSTGQEMRAPLGLCISHMFNHQTHHRGQLHAMMTAAGVEGWVTDLVFMPEG